MRTMLFSYHAQIERADRLAKLEEVLGFTNIILEVEIPQEDKRYCLTSSGILIVKNLRKDFVVTAFAATLSQCHKVCLLAGKKQIPPKLYKRIQKNMNRHKELFELW